MSQLVISNLTKMYGKTKALNSVDLSFEKGVYALLGHNGAGKSTLLNILSTTLDYNEGEVTYNNENLKAIGSAYRDILGYMPQQQDLLPGMTIESFLTYMAVLKEVAKDEISKRVKLVIEQTDLSDLRKKSLDNLSGGMKQRVLIAQALLNNPKILLLDEPTAGLDPVQRMNLRKLISDISKDKIVILATHVISDVELIANKIIIMKEGNILAIKSQAELIAETKVYESYQSIAVLEANDPTFKFVGAMQINDEIKVRFISEQAYDSPVNTTLDDVYLDYLG